MSGADSTCTFSDLLEYAPSQVIIQCLAHGQAGMTAPAAIAILQITDFTVARELTKGSHSQHNLTQVALEEAQQKANIDRTALERRLAEEAQGQQTALAAAQQRIAELESGAEAKRSATDSDVAAARERIAALEGNAGEAAAAHERELAAARERAALLESAAAEAAAAHAKELADARAAHGGLRAELEAARAAAAQGRPEVRSGLEDAHKRITTLERQVTATAAELNSQQDAAKRREAELREALDAAHEEVQARLMHELRRATACA